MRSITSPAELQAAVKDFDRIVSRSVQAEQRVLQANAAKVISSPDHRFMHHSMEYICVHHCEYCSTCLPTCAGFACLAHHIAWSPFTDGECNVKGMWQVERPKRTSRAVSGSLDSSTPTTSYASTQPSEGRMDGKKELHHGR